METTPTPETTAKSSTRRRALIGTAALAVGLAVGGAGLAGAVTGSDSSTSSTPAASATAPARPADGARPDPASMPNGPGETLLTGDTASKVTAAAQAEVPGGTIIRVETDSSGQGEYEAHMTKADGSPVTVLLDKDFTVVATEDGFGPGGPGGPRGHMPPPGASAPSANAGGTSASN